MTNYHFHFPENIKQSLLFIFTFFDDCFVIRSHFAMNVVLGNDKHAWTGLAKENMLGNEH